MDRLTLLGGVFGSEPFLLIFSQTTILILGNLTGTLSWVTGWVLVASVDVLETDIDVLHL